MIFIKRAYDAPAKQDGRRFLVDALWPRGRKKSDLHIEQWLKEVAPSAPLRKWFAHDPDRWEEFQRRYRRELQSKPLTWEPLIKAAGEGAITLIYAARDTMRNNAVVLKECLEEAL